MARAILICFLLFWFVLILIVLFFGFVFLIWLTRFKGSGEVAQRATSLGPKPSLLVFAWFSFVLFSFLFVPCLLF